MAEARFNPSHSVHFDFARGLVSLGAAGSRLLLPAELLDALLVAVPEATRADVGQRLGIELGRRVLEHLGASPADASIEGVVEHLGGELALSGLGSLGVERWGQALIVTLSDCPLGATADPLVGWILEGALQRLFGRDVRAVPLGRIGAVARLLIVGPDTAAQVVGWLRAGASWTVALGRLHDSERHPGGGR